MVGEAMTLADITIASALVYPAKLAMDPKFARAVSQRLPLVRLMCAPAAVRGGHWRRRLAESEMKPEGASICPQGGKKEAKKEKAPKKEKAKKEKAAALPPAPAPKKSSTRSKSRDKKSPSRSTATSGSGPTRTTCPRSGSRSSGRCSTPRAGAFWVCRFKYNHVNEKQFMCANAIGGFVQRSDAMRKWAFGTMFRTGSEARLPMASRAAGSCGGTRSRTSRRRTTTRCAYTWTKIDHECGGAGARSIYWTVDADLLPEGARDGRGSFSQRLLGGGYNPLGPCLTPSARLRHAYRLHRVAGVRTRCAHERPNYSPPPGYGRSSVDALLLRARVLEVFLHPRRPGCPASPGTCPAARLSLGCVFAGVGGSAAVGGRGVAPVSRIRSSIGRRG